jgi:hypothetical protein
MVLPENVAVLHLAIKEKGGVLKHRTVGFRIQTYWFRYFLRSHFFTRREYKPNSLLGRAKSRSEVNMPTVLHSTQSSRMNAGPPPHRLDGSPKAEIPGGCPAS